MYDLLIRGGIVVDGTNTPPRRLDVAVEGGRIVEIGPDLDAANASRVIDAGGKVVSPGFVDTHTHYDAQIHWDPTLDMSSRHGYTSFIGGNCGLSLAPVNSASADYMVSALSKVEGIPIETLQEGVDITWSTFGELLDKLEARGVGVNIGFTVGHTALRALVMGERALTDEATPADVDAMKALLHKSIEEGGLGFSSGRSETHTDMDRRPVASRLATDAELIALASVVGEHEGTKMEYVPNANSTLDDDLRSWMAELSIAAKRPVDFPLVLDQYLTDDEVESLFQSADVARAKGGEVIVQVTGQTTSLYFNLRSGFLYEALPSPWPEVYSVTHEERLQLFRDPDMIDRLEEGARAAVAGGGNLGKPANFGALFIGSAVAPENERFVGRKVDDIATELGLSPFRAVLEIALRDDLRTVLEVRPPDFASTREGWERRVKYLRDNRGVISASDAGAHYDVIDTYAQSSRLISNAVTKFRLMPIEEAVHRLTQVPATVTGLKDRGVIKVGNWGDFVIFDPDAMGTTPTALVDDLPGGGSRLLCGNTGIEYVIVNGEPLWEAGQYTGSLSGTVLRSGRDTVTPHVPR
jgi:N-acyl-D-aspartate/D-glutamate deacylase